MNTPITTHSPSGEPSATVLSPPPAALLFLGALCYYVALPPLNIAALALAVPICWGIVIHRQEPIKWYWVYLTAFLFWLASIWWIACPHPLTSFGLLALATYLSFYWVLFFIATRIAIHRFRIPLLVAMPVCWIGTEYLRCDLVLGGFSFCSLEHAFYRADSSEWALILIQFASIGGSLLVGGVTMFFGATFLTCLSVPGWWRKIVSTIFIFLPSMYLLLLIGLYVMFSDGSYDMPDSSGNVTLHIVALQGDRQVRLNSTPDENAATFRQYIDMARQAASEKPDLMVFPETVCPIPVLAFEGSVTPADLDLTDEQAAEWEQWFRQFVHDIDTPVIFGVSTLVFKDNPKKPSRLNSALLVQPQRGEETEQLCRYDKMHLVMFGEYVPFAEYLPDDFILRTLCPEAAPGEKPVAFPIGCAGQGSEDHKTVLASVNICFESSIAPLVRRNVVALRNQGHEPRVLINISNVGWFWFSQQIEQHLATHVFRAVENRMWYVTATNGGFSAIISPMGVIEHIGKRGAAEPVAGKIEWRTNEEHVLTFYQKYGNRYAMVFGLITLGLAACALRRKSNESAHVSKGK